MGREVSETPAAARSIWTNRDFVVLWSGRLVSTLGSGVSAIALPLLVLALTHSPAKAGAVAALDGAPYFIFSVAAGLAADRWDRRAILIICDCGRALAWGVVGLDVLGGHPSLVVLGAAAVVEGTLFVFHNTAVAAAVPRLVSATQLPAAMAQESMILGVADLAGPALGGALFQAGRAIPFLADASSYLASTGAVLSIRGRLQGDRAKESTSVVADAKEAFRFLVGQPGLRIISLVGGVGDVLFSGITLALIVTAQREAHARPAAIGAIFGAGAIASIAGAFIGPLVLSRLGFARTYLGLGAMGATVFPFLLLARSAVLIGIIWTANVVLLGITEGVARSSYQAQVVPDELRGRVGSLVDLVSTGGLPLGAALAGLSLSAFGPLWTLGLMAVGRWLLWVLLVSSKAVRTASLSAE